VNGKVLKIEGGDYLLCDGLEKTCECGGCQRHRFGNLESKKRQKTLNNDAREKNEREAIK
jgi:hypothetical protein